MRLPIFLSLLILFSCNDDDPFIPNCTVILDCTEEDCAFLNPIGFTADPMPESVLLHFGSVGHIDGFGKSCPPDAYDIYMSDNKIDFTKIIRIEANSGSYLVEDLEEDKEYAFRLVALHCELDSMVAPTRIVNTTTVPLPEFTPNPLSSSFQDFEDFRLASDGDRFIYRTTSDKWYLSSFSNPTKRTQVFSDAFSANWNHDDDIAAVQRIEVAIRPNLNGITSKFLVQKSLATDMEIVLHEIENHWDFKSDVHNPDLYWIHDFHYSLDMQSIYFKSNKDNGSTTIRDQKVFNNIWKLDLTTYNIEPLSDFLSTTFVMTDFTEDPKQPGNFYILGGIDGEEVEIEGALFNEDRVDVYYYNSMGKSLTEVLITDEKENNISIDPSGEHLIISTPRTGSSDLWSYNLENQEFHQITESRKYISFNRWQHVNWISDNEFMCYVRHDDSNKFAVFKLR